MTQKQLSDLMSYIEIGEVHKAVNLISQLHSAYSLEFSVEEAQRKFTEDIKIDISDVLIRDYQIPKERAVYLASNFGSIQEALEYHFRS